jgi:hypothetical protein
MCMIKGDVFISLSRDVFVASASMMLEPTIESHGHSNPLDLWAVCRFLVLTVYFGTPSMFITLWFGFDYGTNPPLGTLII